MRRGGLLLAALLASCGLDSYDNASPTSPDVTWTQGAQTDFTRLSFVHDPARFTGTNFQGYEIYYKVYPSSTGLATALLADRDSLKSSPTRDHLISMGYQRFNASPDSVSAEPLLYFDVALGQTVNVTLDFSAFLEAIRSDPQAAPPVLTTTLTGSEAFPLYRTVNSSTARVYSPFNELVYRPGPDFSATSDMDKAITAATTAYELDVFISTYAFSPTTFNYSYSPPVPWGIIGDFQVSP